GAPGRMLALAELAAGPPPRARGPVVRRDAGIGPVVDDLKRPPGRRPECFQVRARPLPEVLVRGKRQRLRRFQPAQVAGQVGPCEIMFRGLPKKDALLDRTCT